MTTSSVILESCLGTIKSGRRCRRKPKKGTMYCWSHKAPDKTKVYDNDCPVCMEKDEDMFALSCNHTIHTKCAQGLTDLNCPICRRSVKNWPTELRKKIKTNHRVRRRELAEEERAMTQEVIGSEDMGSIINDTFGLFQSDPRMEIDCAVRYLHDRGVPMEHIPEQLTFSISDSSQTTLPPGMIFNLLVSQVSHAIENLHVDGVAPSEDETIQE